MKQNRNQKKKRIRRKSAGYPSGRQKAVAILICLFAWFWADGPAIAGPPYEQDKEPLLQTAGETPALDLYAKSAVLMDGDSGRILYEKDGFHQMPMADRKSVV